MHDLLIYLLINAMKMLIRTTVPTKKGSCLKMYAIDDDTHNWIFSQQESKSSSKLFVSASNTTDKTFSTFKLSFLNRFQTDFRLQKVAEFCISTIVGIVGGKLRDQYIDFTGIVVCYIFDRKIHKEKQNDAVSGNANNWVHFTHSAIEITRFLCTFPFLQFHSSQSTSSSKCIDKKKYKYVRIMWMRKEIKVYII